ncbi:type III secretion system chaperone [Motiliproteus sp. MSK22-1]|uniref:type III secretion system chaperone n=1 Tax=Motiliproteus sp. MSK22-1 TaxID=1897630 RepID=UPI00097B6A31|nr:type III secretion system chaperone [Motiliproteus sp. MSK22-1]OMH25619.1 hypothetical protein BGP75_24025 [Motiliproteus sp. MSK22-1]
MRFASPSDIEPLDKLYEWLSGVNPRLTNEPSAFVMELGGLTLSLLRLSEGIRCTGYLGCDSGNSACVERALRIAAYSIGTYEGGIAVDPSNKQLCLIRLIDGETEQDRVVAVLEDLANQTDVWKQLISTAEGGSRGIRRPVSPALSSREAHFVAKTELGITRKDLHL